MTLSCHPNAGPHDGNPRLPQEKGVYAQRDTAIVDMVGNTDVTYIAAEILVDALLLKDDTSFYGDDQGARTLIVSVPDVGTFVFTPAQLSDHARQVLSASDDVDAAIATEDLAAFWCRMRELKSGHFHDIIWAVRQQATRVESEAKKAELHDIANTLEGKS